MRILGFLIGMALLMVVRWTHLLWVCERARGGTPSSQQSLDDDWPASALGLLYGLALIAWLFRFWGPVRMSPLRGLVAISLMFVGILLRLAGQHALRSAFSWYWTPSSSLITVGIYRWMKHPLLVGYFLEVTSLSVAAQLRSSVCGLLVGLTAVFIVAQARGEEKRLQMHFNEQWRSFARGKWA